MTIKLKIDEDTILVAYAENFSTDITWRELKRLMKKTGISDEIPDALLGLTTLGSIEFQDSRAWIIVKIRPL